MDTEQSTVYVTKHPETKSFWEFVMKLEDYPLHYEVDKSVWLDQLNIDLTTRELNQLFILGKE
jgi:hypothetical protein